MRHRAYRIAHTSPDKTGQSVDLFFQFGRTSHPHARPGCDRLISRHRTCFVSDGIDHQRPYLLGSRVSPLARKKHNVFHAAFRRHRSYPRPAADLCRVPCVQIRAAQPDRFLQKCVHAPRDLPESQPPVRVMLPFLVPERLPQNFCSRVFWLLHRATSGYR